MNLFAKKLTPQEQVRKWKLTLRQEERALERQIRGINNEEMKVKRSLKECAKRKDTQSMRVLARSLVKSGKAKQRIYESKTRLNSVSMQLGNQLAMAKVMGSMQRSTEVMGMMSRLIKVQEISTTMRELAKEMSKAGIIEEMVDEAVGEALDPDSEEEEEAEEEVQKVIDEIVTSKLMQAGTVESRPLPKGKEKEVEPQEVEEEEEQDMDAMRARLAGLSS